MFDDLDAKLREHLGPLAGNGEQPHRPGYHRSEGDDDPAATGEFWDRRPLFRWCWTAGAHTLIPPTLILAEVLGSVRVALGPKFVIPPLVGAAASLNLGVVLVDTTGGGKSAAHRIVAEGTGLGIYVAGLAGTPEGVAAEFGHVDQHGDMQWKRDAVLFHCDEAETLLTVAARPGNAMLSTLRSLVSGTRLQFSYRTTPVHLPALSYAAALVMSGQPEKMEALVSDDEAAGGTTQRFLWLPGGFPDVPDEDTPPPGPLDLQLPAYGGRVAFHYPPEVRAEVRAARRGQLKGGSGPVLSSHEYLTRLKVAALLAAADGSHEVGGADWDDAGHLVEVSRRTVDRVRGIVADLRRAKNLAAGDAEGHRAVRSEAVVAAARHGRIAKRLAEHVHSHAADGGCIRKCLRGALRSTDRGDFDAAADLAAANGWIVAAERIDQSGRHGSEPVPCWTPGAKP